MTAAGILSNLAGIVGPANLFADSAQLGIYGVGRNAPKAAIRPGSNQEVAEIVRLAAAEQLALVPVGARTKLGMNIPLRGYDLALDMTRLDRVVAYDPDDLTMSVEAGIPLRKLSEVLAAHRQFLPLAVPFADRTTVGGTIASGVDPPLRQFYGTARDYVLGMEFVTGDGRIVKSGGRVVKNVSGYDLHKLLIGSLGSLGVMTKINLRTFPAPMSIRVIVACFDSAQEAVGMRQRLAQSPLRPLTVEILSPQAAELLWGTVAARTEPGDLPSDAFPRARWAVIVSYAGNEKVLGRYDRDLRQTAGAAEITTLGAEPTRIALGRVREFVPIALESSPATVIIKMSVLPGRMSELLEDAAVAAEKVGLSWAAIARGVGVVYFALLPEAKSDGARSRVDNVIKDLADACGSRNGNITVPWLPDEWKSLTAPRNVHRTDLDLMRKLKHVFDPNGIFATDPIASVA